VVKILRAGLKKRFGAGQFERGTSPAAMSRAQALHYVIFPAKPLPPMIPIFPEPGDHSLFQDTSLVFVCLAA